MLNNSYVTAIIGIGPRASLDSETPNYITTRPVALDGPPPDGGARSPRARQPEDTTTRKGQDKRNDPSPRVACLPLRALRTLHACEVHT